MKRKRVLSVIVAAMLMATSCNWTGVAVLAAEREQMESAEDLSKAAASKEETGSDSESDKASEEKDADGSDDSTSTESDVESDGSQDDEEPEVKYGTSGNLSYEIRDGEASISECDPSAGGELIIPDTLGGVKVTSIKYDAFFDCTGLTNIIIPDSVASIGERAFSDCTGLTSITLPDGVESIAPNAFSGCSGLVNIDVDEGNSSYSSQNGILYSKDKTKLVICPEGKKGSIVIPDGVNCIGRWAFSGCSGLTNITIPKSVKTIEIIAFNGCTGLKDITIPDGVTSIAFLAFSGCSGLVNIMIPKSVTSIDSSAFDGCTGLESFQVDEENSCYSSKDGVLYNNGKTKLIIYPLGKKGSFDIPYGVTGIGDHAFDGCTGLTSITFPEGVTDIGSFTFSGCTGFTDIVLPESVVSIGSYAFYDCKSLKQLGLPETMSRIGDGAFSNCIGLTDIKVPTGITEIENWTFSGCSNLTNVTIPAGVINIDYHAFYGTGITKINIPNSVTGIGMEAFQDCSELESITIPNSVISIGSDAFGDCGKLSDIYFTGTEEEWDKIENEDQDDFKDATIHYNSVLVTKVQITPSETKITSEETMQFAADVIGVNITDVSVTWSVLGNTSKNTKISEEGLLSIGKDEEAETITVTAVSKADPSKSASVKVTITKSTNPKATFTDVKRDQYFYNAVMWGVNSGAVAGYSEPDGTHTFRPNDTCTRAQFVTFLWRTLGEQQPTNRQNPFKDIDAIGSQYYGTALLWAYENHYVSGYSDPDGVRFGPDDQITRGQVVTFLWRAAGEPKATTTTSPFKDVTKPNEQYYGQAMLWASENGIVSGYSDPDGARFAPDDSCTRGQVVTFLWRYAQKYLK